MDEEELRQLRRDLAEMIKQVYSNLSPWQTVEVARHKDRPYSMDYLSLAFDDFVEMHGDRHFADDPSIVGGLARFNGQACMVLGPEGP